MLHIEALCFLNCNFHCTTVNNMKSLITKHFSEDDIVKAKQELQKFIGDLGASDLLRMPKRTGDNREQSSKECR